MRVLMISTDRKVFEKGSSVLARMEDYADLVEGLHIVVFAKRSLNLQPIQMGNLYLHPTNSSSRLGYIFDAIRIGREIMEVSPWRAWLITAQDPFETGLVGWRIAKSKRKKLQLQIHTDFLSPEFKGILNWIRVAIARFLLPRADGIRVVSKRIAESLKAGGFQLKSNPVTLPIFVDVEPYRTRPTSQYLKEKYPQWDTHILMVSRLSAEKNLVLALKAFRKVVKAHPKTGLVIVGDGPQRGKLERRVRLYGLKDNVVFTGWRDNVDEYYRSTDIFLNTSNFEGYGMALLEAGAAGAAIITTHVGIVGDVFEPSKSVLAAPVGDEEKITAALLKLHDTDQRLLIATEARVEAFAHAYSSKSEYLQNYQKHWEDLVA